MSISSEIQKINPAEFKLKDLKFNTTAENIRNLLMAEPYNLPKTCFKNEISQYLPKGSIFNRGWLLSDIDKYEPHQDAILKILKDLKYKDEFLFYPVYYTLDHEMSGLTYLPALLTLVDNSILINSEHLKQFSFENKEFINPKVLDNGVKPPKKPSQAMTDSFHLKFKKYLKLNVLSAILDPTTDKSDIKDQIKILKTKNFLVNTTSKFTSHSQGFVPVNFREERVSFTFKTPKIVLPDEIFVFNAADVEHQRFYDNNELKYSLRSLEMYMPWARQIFLVTNGQIPNWLDINSPKLKIVTHEEIFPKKVQNSHLPTFSSPAIETHLHRIHGLSENFIYFNDDVFLQRETYLEDFWSFRTGYKVRLSWPIPTCSPGCSYTWLGDGYCDEMCNTPNCFFDNGDCVGNSNENPEDTNLKRVNPDLGNAPNFEMMINGHLDIDNADPLNDEQNAINALNEIRKTRCAADCYDGELSNGKCDVACNFLDCGFDMGECGMNRDEFEQLEEFSFKTGLKKIDDISSEHNQVDLEVNKGNHAKTIHLPVQVVQIPTNIVSFYWVWREFYFFYDNLRMDYCSSSGTFRRMYLGFVHKKIKFYVSRINKVKQLCLFSYHDQLIFEAITQYSGHSYFYSFLQIYSKNSESSRDISKNISL